MIPIDSRLRIFDTTLRDGEQSPGASLTMAAKLEIAHALARLGVDIIEAGFPAASADDFAAVHQIAPEVGRDGGVIICALARACERDIRLAAGKRSSRRRGRASTLFSRPAICTSSTSCGSTASEVTSGCARWSRWRGGAATTWSSAPRTRAAPIRRFSAKC